ncbi:MAG: hypothetical protein ACOVQX_05880 [Legionella sp.]
MKKITVLSVALLASCITNASQLSKFLHELDAEGRKQQQAEWREDMNFSDLSFRLERRYVDSYGQSCRDYVFRAYSNPYKQGRFQVCERRYRY